MPLNALNCRWESSQFNTSKKLRHFSSSETGRDECKTLTHGERGDGREPGGERGGGGGGAAGDARRGPHLRGGRASRNMPALVLA